MTATRKPIAAGVLSAALAIATGLIVKWEPAPGAAMYTAHRDPVGVLEICYGHTHAVYVGMTATQAQCDRWREQDELEAANAVARCIDYPLTSNQLGALIDGVYNLGPRVVCGSTLQKLANAGDMRAACAALGQWIYAAGKPMRGLANRRGDEMPICWPNFATVRAGVA